jgi:DNA (cytosine-5)-methyltransferase 1
MPKTHICERCGKNFKQKSHLDAHMKRKRPCKKDDTLTKIIEERVKEKLEEKMNELVNINIHTMEIGEGGERNEAIKDTNSQHKLKCVDLFAGTGAFTMAFQETGKVRCVFANDMIPCSKIIYDNNFDHPLTLGNLNDISVETIPHHDILTGGFPCQPFSIAGRREGFRDSRSNVFWKILEILRYHSPKVVILENVKNLLTHDNGNTFKTICEELTSIGYTIKSKVLNTRTITDIPQNRERIYIVGFRNPKYAKKFTLDFPDVKTREIKDIVFQSGVGIQNKYYYVPKERPLANGNNGEIFNRRIARWESGENITKMIRDNVTDTNTIYQFRRVYVRKNCTGVCPTLTANMGGGGHNVPLVKDDIGVRKLIPRECFRLQGFPDTYSLDGISDTNLYKLSGNAVSVPVVKLIAGRVIEVLQETH